MVHRLVFSQGRWVSVKLPPAHDPAWTDSDFWFYAVTWAAAVARGFAEGRAEQIAEATVSKRLYPGCVFYRDLEDDIAKVTLGD